MTFDLSLRIRRPPDKRTVDLKQLFSNEFFWIYKLQKRRTKYFNHNQEDQVTMAATAADTEPPPGVDFLSATDEIKLFKVSDVRDSFFLILYLIQLLIIKTEFPAEIVVNV